MRLALSLTSLLLAGSAQAAPAQLVSGPMAGPPEHRAVKLWLQASGAAQARIEYWPLAAGQSAQRLRSAAVSLQPSAQYSAHISLDALQPGTRYAYRLLLDGKPAGETQQFATQELWQWRRDAPDFTLLAGSCNYINEPEVDRPGKPYGDRHDIFDRMAAQQPDLTLWLGDNLYFREVDYSSPESMARRWAYERRQPFLQKLLRTGAHAAIWDDHDYGPNDANSSFVHKQAALELQQRYWANRSYGLPGTPGAFGTFSFNDVDVFLLDNRWYRDDPDLNDAQRAMYGAAQMRWLKNALLASTARFKLIAGGSQQLHKSPRGDSWMQYPAEREDFLKFLADSKLPGVLFLSGDVHRSEFAKLERPGLYPLHELTCSPLSSGTHYDEKLLERPGIIPGSVLLNERSFCKLRVEGTRAERRIVVEQITADGQPRFRLSLSAADLGTPWSPPAAKP